MPSRTFTDALRTKLRESRCQSKDERYFYPETCLHEIFTPDAVGKAVTELNCQPEERIGLKNAILLKGLKTFAILVSINREEAIVDFRRRERLESMRLLEAGAIGDSSSINLVEEHYWHFHPHFFHLGDDIEIDQRKILPIIREDYPIAEGGFGSVSRVEVHPLLQDFYPNAQKPVVLVRKTLHKLGVATQTSIFNNEKRCLMLLDCRKHPNIVPFLGAYKYRHEFFFIFPVLEMDLKTFFKGDRYYGDFRWDFTFVAALRGISSALSYIHDVRLQLDTEGVDFTGLGYHHDLRPANILVTKETFVLADFGLARLKPAEEYSTTRWKAGVGDYLAPECMNQDFENQYVGRAIDVWAFGCLMAETVTFMRQGPQGLDEFRKSRSSISSFWESFWFFDDQGHLKDSIKQWLDTLDLNCHPTSIEKMLHILVEKALVPSTERPKISDISKLLLLLHIRAQYAAVLDCLNIIVTDPARRSNLPGDSLKLWQERERLKIFGRALYLHENILGAQNPKSNAFDGEKCVEILQQLFQKLHGFKQSTCHPSEFNDDGSHTSKHLDGTGLQISVAPTNLSSTTTVALVADVQHSTQELWKMLPEAQVREVESTWINRMLDLEAAFQTESLPGISSPTRHQISDTGQSENVASTLRESQNLRDNGHGAITQDVLQRTHDIIQQMY